MLSAKGVPVLTQRKLFTIGGFASHSLLLLAFGQCKTPRTATAVLCATYCSTAMYGSGWTPNYLEVGGVQDSALLNGVGNTLACLGGLWIPALGVVLRRRFGGSWTPLWIYSVVLNVIAASVYGVYASVTPARKTLYNSRRARKLASSSLD